MPECFSTLATSSAVEALLHLGPVVPESTLYAAQLSKLGF